MLLASALNRRFNDRRLQTDPRLRRVVADARWAASSIDANLLVPKEDQDPRSVLGAVIQDQVDTRKQDQKRKPLPKDQKRKPLPKKTAKKATKRKKVFAAADCVLTCVC